MQLQIPAHLGQDIEQGLGLARLSAKLLIRVQDRIQATPGHQADQGHDGQGHQHFHQSEAFLARVCHGKDAKVACNSASTGPWGKKACTVT
uniref:Uncharacterized protein n=1 Tax=Panagrolaimus superbus TaxID=310955 RepID=A0A914Y0B7_9BILA